MKHQIAVPAIAMAALVSMTAAVLWLDFPVSAAVVGVAAFGLGLGGATLLRDRGKHSGNTLALEGFLESESLLALLASDGTILKVSKGWEQIMAAQRATLIGRGLLEFVHPDDLMECVTTLSLAPDESQTRRARVGPPDGPFAVIDLAATRQGDQIFLSATDATDKLAHLTDVERLAHQLEKAEELGQLGSWTFDLDSGTIVWSKQLYRLFRRDPALGPPDYRSALDMYAPDDARSLAIHQRATLDSGVPYSLLLRTADDSNPARWIRAEGRARRNESGAIVGLRGTALDVTAQAEREAAIVDAKAAAEDSLKARNEFLTNMSHEIRTPLTAILGYAEVLCEADPPPPAQDTGASAAAVIRRNAEHLLALVNDVLDLSKIEAGMMTVESLTVDPADVITSVGVALRETAEAKGLDLRVDIDEDVAPISSDSTRLRQVVHNLMSNAVKFTASGMVRVRATRPSPNQLVIKVSDTGIGMDRSQLDIVRRFEAFRQADGSMSRRFGGSGLGLRISSQLVSLLGGHLEVESARGEGSTFTIVMATTAPQNPPKIEKPGPVPTPSTPRPLSDCRVLLVEDGPDNQRLISHHLRRAGAEVTILENGRLAFDRVRDTADEFDLILMDMQMPELDGYTATELTRMLGVETPIIALTAHAMSGDRERCLAVGCSDYLAKPVTRDALIERCASWLHRVA
ncbi:MAG: ATP-binding protein [Planctomycetota bacterium]